MKKQNFLLKKKMFSCTRALTFENAARAQVLKINLLRGFALANVPGHWRLRTKLARTKKIVLKKLYFFFGVRTEAGSARD